MFTGTTSDLYALGEKILGLIIDFREGVSYAAMQPTRMIPGSNQDGDP